jgi:hypothetical protein
MSGWHIDPDEMANCFDFDGDEFGGDEFDFEQELNPEDIECAPHVISNRMMASPIESVESTEAEFSALADNTNSQNFPVLLHEIVSNDDFDCINWLPCGTLFAISDKELFTKQVLPRYFDTRGGTKFTSFTRRLKRWDFNRIASGKNIGAYFREGFLRDRPDMASTIRYPVVKRAAKNKGSPTPVVNKSKDKARRRASTGCIPEKPVDFGYTPIPVKPSVQIDGNPSLLELDSDMADLLASPDFVESDEPDYDLKPASFESPPASVPNLQLAPVTESPCKEILISNEMQSASAQPEKLKSAAFNNNMLEPTSTQTEKLHFNPFNEVHPTSTQSEKLHLTSSGPPKMISSLPFQARPFNFQPLLQNTSLTMAQRIQQIQQTQSLVFSEMNLGQRQQMTQKQASHPQTRRHSCMPMFGASSMSAHTLFGPAVPMAIYNQPSPFLEPNSAFNPMLQPNGMPMNQSIAGQHNMTLEQRSKFFGPCGGKVMTSTPIEVDSSCLEQEDKIIDFDEYIAREED